MRNDSTDPPGDTADGMGTLEHLRLIASHPALLLRRLFSATAPAQDADLAGEAAAAKAPHESSASVALFTSLDFMASDTRVSMLASDVAAAVAVDAYPSPESARVALEAVKALRERFPRKMSGLVGVAFRGEAEPSNETVDVLEDGCVYVAINNLRPSAIDNAREFLAEIASKVPEARRIAMLGQVPH